MKIKIDIHENRGEKKEKLFKVYIFSQKILHHAKGKRQQLNSRFYPTFIQGFIPEKGVWPV